MISPIISKGTRLIASLSMVLLYVCANSLDARSVDPCLELREKLTRGDIVVGLKNVGESKYVTGSVMINEPLDKVWAIVVNPFEFRQRISPRMKEVEMMVDKRDRSVMRVLMDVMLIPNFNYVVESHYENAERIEFHRVAGTLKDFKGSWEMLPVDNGLRTELTYSMYLDPGFFVPQWIIREGVKTELPRILGAVRQRVLAVSRAQEQPEAHTIAAASLAHHLDIAGTNSSYQ